ncbi:unnamed protein product, partial [Prunus brigantina]
DYSPYPTGIKDHDYKTWNYRRQLHAFFFSRNLVLEWGNNYYITWVYRGQEYMELGLQSLSRVLHSFICTIFGYVMCT